MTDEDLRKVIDGMKVVLDRLRADVDKLMAGAATAAPAAPAADIDSPHGDPAVFRDPRDWKGQSMVGRKYSQCPPEFLEMLAGFLEWRAGKEEEEQKTDTKGRPKAQWTRKDAARARAWAARIRTRGSNGSSAGEEPLPF